MKSTKHIVCVLKKYIYTYICKQSPGLNVLQPKPHFLQKSYITYNYIYTENQPFSLIVYFSIQMYDFWLLTCQLDIVGTDTKRLDFHHIKKFKGHTPLIGTLAASNGCIITNRIHLGKVSHMWLKGLEIFMSICFESWFAKWFMSFKLRKFILWIYEGDS